LDPLSALVFRFLLFPAYAERPTLSEVSDAEQNRAALHPVGAGDHHFAFPSSCPGYGAGGAQLLEVGDRF
jgi:hypothetical protein